ncbi:hypothetical protein Acr_17g0000210 [Actinidia rufa]|uniref:Uncharacterized protein n=1 Tax=Actinidia rufa TaxID=165716 RepID=A0A7J0G0I0_9ERIC|nr:hypothetical protein Acr_17g0000210 [Actinidia rufa]
MASQKHRQAVLNALNKAHVSIGTSLEDLMEMIMPNKFANTIVVTERDLPSEGGKHNRPLHITIECLQKWVLVALIDNGSALNICPLRTVLCLGLDPKKFGSSTQGDMDVVPSTLHQKIKLILDGKVHGDLTIPPPVDVNKHILKVQPEAYLTGFIFEETNPLPKPTPYLSINSHCHNS